MVNETKVPVAVVESLRKEIRESFKPLEQEVEGLRKDIKKAAEALPKQLCNCAFTVWHRKLDFDTLHRAIASELDWEWIEDTLPHVAKAIADIETDCKLDLEQARLALNELSRLVEEKRNLAAARNAAFKITDKIALKLFECGA